MEWMESRERCHFYAQWFFCFEMGLQNQNVDILFFVLWFPISVSTHLYELEASSLLIQDWYHENTPILRACRDTDHAKYWCAPLQVWLCRPLPCAWRTYVSSQKNLCQCSPIGKIVSFSTFLSQMLACGCSVYLEYCFWLTIHGRNCLQSASLSRGAETASMSLPNPFLLFTHLAVLGFLLS